MFTHFCVAVLQEKVITLHRLKMKDKHGLTN